MTTKQIAKQMLVESPDYIEDARAGARVGNSVVGSLISLIHGTPRQYAEQGVREALREIDAEEAN